MTASLRLRRAGRAVGVVLALSIGWGTIGMGSLGGVGSAAAQPVAAPAATTLSIRALQSAVQPGGTGAIAGNLQVAGGSPEGRTVDLEARQQGEDAFTPIGTVIADEEGKLRLTVQPAVTTRYRWRYAGDVDARSRVSGVATVRVRTPQHAAHRRATTLSAVAVSGVVVAGGKDVVRGQLRWAEKRLARRQVVLLARPVGQKSWRFRTSHRTRGMGRVAFAVRPRTSTEYRLAFAGTSVFRPSTSAVVTVDVRPTLTITAAPSRVDPGGSTTLSGTIAHAGSPVAGATIQLLSRPVVQGSTWTVEATAPSAADGSVAFSARPESVTRYRLRAQPVGGLPRGVSRVVEVQVRAASSLTIVGEHLAGGFVVSGRLTAAGKPVIDASVTLQSFDGAAQSWDTVTSAQTGATGKVSFNRASAPGTGYRLVYAGDRFATATSATVTD